MVYNQFLIRILRPRFIERTGRELFETVDTLSSLNLAQLVPLLWISTVISQLEVLVEAYQERIKEDLETLQYLVLAFLLILNWALLGECNLEVAPPTCFTDSGIAAVRATRYSGNYSLPKLQSSIPVASILITLLVALFRSSPLRESLARS